MRFRSKKYFWRQTYPYMLQEVMVKVPPGYDMIINHLGNIGIGTLDPKAMLHINNGNNSYGVILELRNFFFIILQNFG